MVTNAVPMAAGFVLFGDTLPHGIQGAAQVAAFGCLLVSAVALGYPRARGADEPFTGGAGETHPASG